jgi:hypothetical protein
MESEHRRLDRRFRNEQLFRTVNSKLRELNAQFEYFTDDAAPFVCECARLECIEQVSVPLDVFDELQRHPGRFVLVAGHESPELEDVVARAAGYVVVEKRPSADS